MGRLLDAVDRSIDVNAIIFKRCLETISSIVGQRAIPQFYGPEQDPGSSDGVLGAAVAIFNEIKKAHPAISEEGLILEYTSEESERNRLAREQRADVPIGEVTLGGSPNG